MEMTLSLGSSDKHTEEKVVNPTQEENQISAFNAAFQSARLEEGKLGLFETVEDEARRNFVSTKIPDAMKNKEYYDRFIEMQGITIGDAAKTVNRKRYEKAIEDGLFDLDENENVIDGSNHFFGADLLFNKDTIKGFLLAKRNGYNENALRAEYQNIVKSKEKLFQTAEKNLTDTLLGGMTGYLASPETATDFASPSKIMGSTIVKGALKSFGVESLYVMLGETSRESNRKRHADMMDEDRTLWDSTSTMLVNIGFAGAIRGIGSTIVDANTMRQIHSKIPDITDKQIFSRYAQRENYKLTKDSIKHIHLVEKAQEDIEKGKTVDVSGQTDIDINEKFTDNTEPINIVEEIKNQPEAKIDAEMKNAIDNHIDEALKEETDVYYSDDTLIDDAMKNDDFWNDPEIDTLVREIELTQNYQSLDDLLKDKQLNELLDMRQDVSAKDIRYNRIKVQDAQMIEDTQKIGGVDKTQFVPGIYEKNYLSDFQLTKQDVQRIRSGNITPEIESKLRQDLYTLKNNPDYIQTPKYQNELTQDLIDEGYTINDLGEFIDPQGKVLFSKFADNLAVGTIAGVETDENGNITFDPEKFIAGLGGTQILKQAYKSGIFDNLPEEINNQVKKYFGVDLEMAITDIPKVKTTSKKTNYTEQELEKMIENGKGDELDKLAFGHNDGEITNIKIDDINLIYDDIENAEYKFEKGGMNWVKSVKFDEPIQVSIDENGKINLEDGHHRYFAAKKLGKKEINAEIELKGNPIRKILKDQNEK